MMTDQAAALRQIVKRAKQGEQEPIQAQGEASRRGARVISVTSGKGGVGKTNFTVNFAIALAEMGKRVIVIDADFGLSNVDLVLGASSRYNLAHLLYGGMKIADIISEAHGIMYISGGSGILDLINMSGEEVSLLVANLTELDRIADVVIFDTGAGISDNLLKMLSASNEVIVVTTPEPTAVMDAYALIKTVVAEYPDTIMRLIVNNAEDMREAEHTMERLTGVALQYLHVNIERLGCVLRDTAISRAVREQRPVIISQPKSAAARSIRRIAGEFDSRPETKQRGFYAFFKRMLGSA